MLWTAGSAIHRRLHQPQTAVTQLSLYSAGEQLAGTTYSHPLCDRVSSLLVGGDYVTADSGTGLVHSAPGHGQEDYQVSIQGLKLRISVIHAGI